MWFLAVGVVLLLLKWMEVGFDRALVVVDRARAVRPRAAVFEVVEPYFGLDRKKAHNDLEKVKQERIRKGLGNTAPPRR